MQSVTAITKVQNGTILLEQSMTAHMSLLTATGIFGLEKRNLKSVACLISVLSLKIKRKIKKNMSKIYKLYKDTTTTDLNSGQSGPLVKINNFKL